ncbi:MAG: DUF4013 domain-containing protein [Haloferacaceae archaeon]
MLREALRSPARGPDVVFTVAVGGGLHLLAEWVRLVPFVVVLGFLVRTLGYAAAPDERARPAFGLAALPGLVRDGLAGAVVAIAYLAVPVAVLVTTTWGLVGRGGGGGAGLIVVLGATAALAFVAPFLYLLPAGLTGYAVEGRLRAAVDRSRLRRCAGNARYLVAWLVGVAALGTVVALYRLLAPVVVGFFLAFYVEVAVAALLGRSVGETVGSR